MNEDRWSCSSEEEEDYNSLNYGKHRIPSTRHPLAFGYIQPLQQYLDKWKDDSTFYQDFIYSCPFTNENTKHLITKLEILSTHKAWGYLFDYFSTTYTADELADLVFEALCYLREDECYLKFLINHHYMYMWPQGNNFCDPSLPIPSTLLY